MILPGNFEFIGVDGMPGPGLGGGSYGGTSSEDTPKKTDPSKIVKALTSITDLFNKIDFSVGGGKPVSVSSKPTTSGSGGTNVVVIPKSSNNQGLSTGAKIGIAVGVTFVAGIGAFLLFRK